MSELKSKFVVYKKVKLSFLRQIKNLFLQGFIVNNDKCLLKLPYSIPNLYIKISMNDNMLNITNEADKINKRIFFILIPFGLLY